MEAMIIQREADKRLYALEAPIGYGTRPPRERATAEAYITARLRRAVQRDKRVWDAALIVWSTHAHPQIAHYWMLRGSYESIPVEQDTP